MTRGGQESTERLPRVKFPLDPAELQSTGHGAAGQRTWYRYNFVMSNDQAESIWALSAAASSLPDFSSTWGGEQRSKEGEKRTARKAAT